MTKKMKMKMISGFFFLSLSWLLLMPFQFAYSGDSKGINQIISMPKNITKADNYVVVKGRWKKVSGNRKAKGNKPPLINTVSIICEKESMKCREVIAEVATPKDIGAGEQTFLNIDETIYKIIMWSQGVIRAKNTEYRVSDFELQVSLENNSAERTRRETRDRGCNSCDPAIYEKWVIE